MAFFFFLYQARTGDASDGCAIFWNNKLYGLWFFLNFSWILLLLTKLGSFYGKWRPAGKSCSFCSSFLATSTEIENCLLLIVSISFLSNLCYFQFTNISGYRFDILHEESIEFQNFNLRNNVCQLCVFKVNLPCISLLVSFFFWGVGGFCTRDNIAQCSDDVPYLLEALVSFNLFDIFLWHFQCADYFDKLLNNVTFGSLYLAESADQTNQLAAVTTCLFLDLLSVWDNCMLSFILSGIFNLI